MSETKLTKRQKEILYSVLSRELDKADSTKEFNELDKLRDKFKTTKK